MKGDDNMLNKIINYNYKDAMIGLLALFVYFFLSLFETVPLELAGMNINSLSYTVKIIYLIIYEIFTVATIILIFNKKIKKDFNNIIKNHKEYYSKYFKVWLIGLAVMLLSNAFIIFILDNEIAGNETTIRSLFEISPIYIYLSSVIYAPVVEELIFRQGIRNIFGRNIIFIFISGVIFGGLHVIGNITTPSDLLYLIPYSSLGIAFAYMLYKTDNIFVSMGFHFLHNGILISLQFLTLLFA